MWYDVEAGSLSSFLLQLAYVNSMEVIVHLLLVDLSRHAKSRICPCQSRH